MSQYSFTVSNPIIVPSPNGLRQWQSFRTRCSCPARMVPLVGCRWGVSGTRPVGTTGLLGRMIRMPLLVFLCGLKMTDVGYLLSAMLYGTQLSSPRAPVREHASVMLRPWFSFGRARVSSADDTRVLPCRTPGMSSCWRKRHPVGLRWPVTRSLLPYSEVITPDSPGWESLRCAEEYSLGEQDYPGTLSGLIILRYMLPQRPRGICLSQHADRLPRFNTP